MFFRTYVECVLNIYLSTEEKLIFYRYISMTRHCEYNNCGVRKICYG